MDIDMDIDKALAYFGIFPASSRGDRACPTYPSISLR